MKRGWQTKKIGDVCHVMTGGTPSKAKQDYFGGEIKWLVSGDINQGEIFDCEGRITETGMKNSNAKLLPINSVMIALNGQGKTRGTVALLRTEATCNQSLVSIYPKEPQKLLPEYLFANLHGRYQEIRRMTGDSGNDRRGLNMGLVKSIDIPIAPLPEQQRIVGILDEAFDGIATAKANAEKNLQNARTLFESYLQSVFTRRGEGWVEKRKPLADLCELIVDCEHKTAPTQVEGIPSIRTPNIGKGKLLLDGVNRVSKKTYTEWTRRAEPAAGDLILAREAPAGNIAVIPENLPLCLGQRTVLIRPKHYVFDSEFLAMLLLQPAMQRKLLAHSRGATVQHVNMKDIRALNVDAVPPLAEQRSMVSKLTSVSTKSEKLVSIHQRKLAALDELKKSLLHKAFSGRL